MFIGFGVQMGIEFGGGLGGKPSVSFLNAPKYLRSRNWVRRLILLMEEVLHHLEPLNYGNSLDFRDLRWCKISSLNNIELVPKTFCFLLWILGSLLDLRLKSPQL